MLVEVFAAEIAENVAGKPMPGAGRLTNVLQVDAGLVVSPSSAERLFISAVLEISGRDEMPAGRRQSWRAPTKCRIPPCYRSFA